MSSLSDHVKIFLMYAFVVAIGAGMTQQLATNTRLSAYLGSGLFAALISFVVGLIALSIIYGAQKSDVLRKISERRFSKTASASQAHLPRPWWIYTGGVMGALYVSGTIYSSIVIGLALSFAVSVSGQLFCASLIDHIGFLGTPVRSFTVLRCAGLLLACAGCALSVTDRVQQGDVGVTIAFCIIVLLCGVILPVQTCINRRFAHRVCQGDILKSAIFSFMTGSLTLGIASGILTAVFILSLNQSVWNFADASAWTFTGGLLGAFFVYGTLLIAPYVGMARLFMCIVLGQLSSSLLYDHFGILGLTEHTATPLRIAGTLMVLVGAIINSMPSFNKVAPSPTAVPISTSALPRASGPSERALPHISDSPKDTRAVSNSVVTIVRPSVQFQLDFVVSSDNQSHA